MIFWKKHVFQISKISKRHISYRVCPKNLKIWIWDMPNNTFHLVYNILKSERYGVNRVRSYLVYLIYMFVCSTFPTTGDVVDPPNYISFDRSLDGAGYRLCPVVNFREFSWNFVLWKFTGTTNLRKTLKIILLLTFWDRLWYFINYHGHSVTWWDFPWHVVTHQKTVKLC